MNTTWIKPACCFFLAVVLPFLMDWGYLYASRTQSWGTDLSDYFPLAIGLVIGLIAISVLPLQKQIRILLSIIYVPTISFLTTMFGFIYVCGRFGACL